MENETHRLEELGISANYGWKLTGQGCSCSDDDGEPNEVISEWEVVFYADDDVGDDKHEIGKIIFKVVNQGEATNRGEDFYDVYDSEDSFHFHYYEHVEGIDELDDLRSVSRVILLTDDDLAVFQSSQRFDVLQILSQVFSDVVIAVHCDDLNSAVGVQLATVFDELPRLRGDGPQEGWLYHNSRYRWLRKVLEISAA